MVDACRSGRCRRVGGEEEEDECEGNRAEEEIRREMGPGRAAGT